VYACENKQTLSVMLKGYFNFSGFVVSDWGATHSVSDAINAGLDIDMPDNHYFSNTSIHAALEVKNITVDQLHDSCIRIMSGWYNVPEDKRFPCDGGICIKNNVSTPANKQLARKIAAMSTVLVQNNGNLLPLAKGTKQKIALIGSDAVTPYTAGSGSGGVPTSNVQVSPLEAFQRLGLNVVYDPANSTDAAKAAASDADIAIIFGSAHSGEGHDRTDLLFYPPQQPDGPTMEAVIAAVAGAQKNTIVVAAVPGQILTDWRHQVASILIPFLPGEQYGNAIADIIFGDVTPQAKLPLSFPNVDNEQGMSVAQWPGLNSTQFGSGTKEANYSEGQIVGYRWYDKHNVAAAFPFGHGLTYGGFTYSDLTVTGRTISFTVTGTGCDTPQIYLGYPTATTDVQVPVKVLRGFQKTCEASTTVSYTVTDRDVSNWDIAEKAYTITSGTYTVHVGASSQDVRLTGSLIV
jgi:beta-glucosidase